MQQAPHISRQPLSAAHKRKRRRVAAAAESDDFVVQASSSDSACNSDDDSESSRGACDVAEQALARADSPAGSEQQPSFELIGGDSPRKEPPSEAPPGHHVGAGSRQEAKRRNSGSKARRRVVPAHAQKRRPQPSTPTSADAASESSAGAAGTRSARNAEARRGLAAPSAGRAKRWHAANSDTGDLDDLGIHPSVIQTGKRRRVAKVWARDFAAGEEVEQAGKPAAAPAPAPARPGLHPSAPSRGGSGAAHGASGAQAAAAAGAGASGRSAKRPAESSEDDFDQGFGKAGSAELAGEVPDLAVPGLPAHAARRANKRDQLAESGSDAEDFEEWDSQSDEADTGAADEARARPARTSRRAAAGARMRDMLAAEAVPEDACNDGSADDHGPTMPDAPTQAQAHATAQPGSANRRKLKLRRPESTAGDGTAPANAAVHDGTEAQPAGQRKIKLRRHAGAAGAAEQEHRPARPRGAGANAHASDSDTGAPCQACRAKLAHSSVVAQQGATAHACRQCADAGMLEGTCVLRPRGAGDPGGECSSNNFASSEFGGAKGAAGKPAPAEQASDATAPHFLAASTTALPDELVQLSAAEIESLPLVLAALQAALRCPLVSQRSGVPAGIGHPASLLKALEVRLPSGHFCRSHMCIQDALFDRACTQDHADWASQLCAGITVPCRDGTKY